MFDLNGKVAMVTGAATGIGAAIAVALAENGADVAISDQPGVSLAKTASKAGKYGHDVFSHEIDVRVMEQIRDSDQALETQFGKIDILVNNAGINRPMAGLEVTEENWDDHYNTNIKG